MKIGVVSIGNDSMELFRMMQRHDHEYHVYYDAESRPLGEKSLEEAEHIVQAGIDHLLTVGVDTIIVPPLRELRLGRNSNDSLMPLFATYMLQHCLPASLMGKLGILAEPMNADGVAQTMIQTVTEDYTLTDRQRQIRRFHDPMVYRVQDVRMWPLLLRSLSPRAAFVNTVIKHDLRYFRDADVDTIIPTCYAYFAYEKTIQRYFNTKRQKFHGMAAIEECFVGLTAQVGSYSVTVHHRGRREMLQQHQKYRWAMQRGKQIEVSFVAIE